MADNTVRAALGSAFEAVMDKLASSREASRGTLLGTLSRYVVPDLNNPTHVILLGLVVFFAMRSLASAMGGAKPERFAMDGVRRRPVVAKRDFTAHELAEYDGRDEATPVYIGVKGTVYDVSSGRAYYGPGGPYSTFAGRDASRGLAKASFEKDVLTDLDDPIDDLSDLDTPEQASLDEWAEFFADKYPAVGKLVGPTAPWKDKTEDKTEEEAKEDATEEAASAEDKKTQ